jgi:hypothetical protein
MTTNGNYVTRAEMTAHISPMKEDITEMKADIKTLLKRDAGRKAITSLFWRTSTVIATLGCGFLTALAFH